MTTEERMVVAETYVKAANKRLLVLVHVGHNSIAESKKLAAHAQQIGADAISSVAGFYFKPASVENLVDSMAAIAAAAPAIPFYYYHIPALTGVSMDMVSFLELGEKQIPNLAGIKYTAATLHEYQACLAYKQSKFDILFGYDEMLLSALTVGAQGAIGSTYTFAAPLYHKLIAAFAAKKLEEARAIQLLVVQMVRELVRYSPIAAQKAIMAMRGMDLGPCRLPLNALTQVDRDTLEVGLAKIKFFEALDAIGDTAPILK